MSDRKPRIPTRSRIDRSHNDLRVVRSVTSLRAAGVWLVALGLAACGGESAAPTAPAPTQPPDFDVIGDPVAGRLAFEPSCGACHASRDGIDLSLFRFTSQDIVRRGVAHVDSTMAIDIAAYIRSLDGPSFDTRVPPFQPAGKMGPNDAEFWRRTFGTYGWPAGMTADALRAINPRDIAVPIAMPLWSHEAADSDWMPDGPIPFHVLDHSGGLVGDALDAYYATPSEANLVTVLEHFDHVTEGSTGLCSDRRYEACFDARRWIASLAAQHYLRDGVPSEVPVRVAQTWWDVGESMITIWYGKSDEYRANAFANGASWMYLAYSYAPGAFIEPAGYMGTFMASQDLFHLSTFAALRRMVAEGPAHDENPQQFLHDGDLATGRAPVLIRGGLGVFVLDYFVQRLEAGAPAGLSSDQARAHIDDVWRSARGFANGDQRLQLDALRTQALQLLP